MKKILFLILFVSISGLIFGFGDAVGGYEFSSNRICKSPRSAGMAGNIAFKDNVYGLYTNPASIALIEDARISFNYNKYLVDINMNGSFHVNMPISKKFKIATGVEHLSSGDIEGTDISGYPTGDFSASLTTISFGAGYYKSEQFIIGSAINLLVSDLDDELYTSYAANIGIIHTPPMFKHFTVFLAAKDIYQYKDSDNKEDFSYTLRAGFAFTKFSKLPIHFEFVAPKDIEKYIVIGTEYLLYDKYTFRAGFSNIDQGGEPRLSFGFGTNYRQYDLDYSMIYFGYLGFSNQISISTAF